MTNRYLGKRVTVMGLGRRGGGLGVARYLAEQGALVTVTDMKPAEAFAEELAVLAGFEICFALGGHRARDFMPEGADFVVRNPGVRRTSEWLRLARETGVPVEMEMSLFFRDCPAPIIGVTGTKGKTTTATLCAGMLACHDPRTVLAGNMGVSALAQLGQIDPSTPVVIELSSWQVEALDEHRRSPRIAVITNISEDHLDAYESFADYAETKRRLACHQSADDVVVLNHDDVEAWRAREHSPARVVPFGRGPRDELGVWVDGRTLVARIDQETLRQPLPDTPALAGDHMALNAAAAAAAALARGAPWTAIQTGLARFSGVRDRMEPVAEIGGVAFVNDTSATAPAATVAALARFAGRRVHLIAGGADKRLDQRPLAAAAAEHGSVVYLLSGTVTPTLTDVLREFGVPVVGPFADMASAVRAAANAAAAGEVVLLSPGSASFGLFVDEFDRGERFRAAVHALANGGLPAAASEGGR